MYSKLSETGVKYYVEINLNLFIFIGKPTFKNSPSDFNLFATNKKNHSIIPIHSFRSAKHRRKRALLTKQSATEKPITCLAIPWSLISLHQSGFATDAYQYQHRSIQLLFSILPFPSSCLLPYSLSPSLSLSPYPFLRFTWICSSPRATERYNSENYLCTR